MVGVEGIATRDKQRLRGRLPFHETFILFEVNVCFMASKSLHGIRIVYSLGLSCKLL